MNANHDPLPLAQSLIRRKSVTPDDDGAQDALARALSELGFACRPMPFGGIANLYARLGSDGPNFCFAGHTDVVPTGGPWTVDPFGAEVIDGYLYGRGAVDMKGAIACFVAAVARRLAQAGPPPGSISLLITGDEEGPAIHGTRAVLDRLAEEGERIDACLVGEPTSPNRIGEAMKIGRRGSLNARLRVLGAQGHVAYPHRADNPIPRLLRVLNALTEAPLDQGSAHFQASNLEVTTIDVGNPAVNVIPAEATAGFNIRFNDLHSGASLGEWIRGLCDRLGGAHELAIEVSGESFLTPIGPLSEAVAEACREVTGLVPAADTGGGTSDARFIRNACPVLEFGLVGQTMHKIDERVAVADLETLTRIYEGVLRRAFDRPW
ncbi:MAG: succinyl-diaminopimelate desuccinylase [Alphaproteobacteria bacterium]|nr:succinyl-diaminopimelate desuccinylase [Alphaproteobacteria bacterium]